MREPLRINREPPTERIALVDIHRAEASIESLSRRHLDRVEDNTAILAPEEIPAYFALESAALLRASEMVAARARRLARGRAGSKAEAV